MVRMMNAIHEESRELGVSFNLHIEALRRAIEKAIEPLKADLLSAFKVDMLAQQLLNLRAECERTDRNNAFLASLRYDAIYARHEQIAEAHCKTFEWLFDSSIVRGDDGMRPSFDSWLTSGNGIYWISGKPGSGKSTLVKWIWHDRRTLGYLGSWAGKSALVTASHFFWAAGADLQKSQQGLLRSLLFDALRNCPDLIPVVAEPLWQRSWGGMNARSMFDSSYSIWTMSELSASFLRLKNQTDIDAKFCFFVDGLDEYDGDHQEIVDLFDLLADSDHVKVCLSSRPWNVFQAAFGHLKSQSLRLETLTRHDIRQFAEDRLGQNRHFKSLKASDSKYQSLLEEIVDASQGVFLWVVLVVRSLLRGLTNADTIAELQRRLRLLPTDLEKFFKHILDTTEDIYHQRASQAFIVAQQAQGPLSLMTYSFLDEEDPEFALHSPIVPTTDREKLSRLCRMKTRLNAQCNGLLECTWPRSSWLDSLLEDPALPCGGGITPVVLSQAFQVQFLHRTVRDFVATRDIQNILQSRCRKDFRPDVAICYAVLAELRTLDCTQISAEEMKTFVPNLMRTMATNANSVEIKYGSSLFTVLEATRLVLSSTSPEVMLAILRANCSDSVDVRATKAGQCGFKTIMDREMERQITCGRTTFEHFVVQSRLRLYLEHTYVTAAQRLLFTEQLLLISLLPSRLFDHDAELKKRDGGITEAMLDYSYQKGILNTHSIQMCRSVPYHRYFATSWEAFLEFVIDLWIEPGRSADTQKATTEEDDTLIAKMEVCLKAGADPNHRRSCQSGRPEDSVLLFLVIFIAAISLDGGKYSRHSRTHRITELFLQYGVDLDTPIFRGATVKVHRAIEALLIGTELSLPFTHLMKQSGCNLRSALPCSESSITRPQPSEAMTTGRASSRISLARKFSSSFGKGPWNLDDWQVRQEEQMVEFGLIHGLASLRVKKPESQKSYEAYGLPTQAPWKVSERPWDNPDFLETSPSSAANRKRRFRDDSTCEESLF